MDPNNFIKIIDRINTVLDMASLEQVCESFTKLSNLSYYLLTVIETTSLYSPEIRIHSNFPEEWMDEVKEWSLCDNPFIGSYMSKHAPEKWSLRDLKMNRNMGFDGQGGLKDTSLVGLSVPIKSVSGEIVSFIMAAEENSQSNYSIDVVMPFAHTFAAHLFDRYMRIKSDSDETKKLTQRETDCLFWACEGKTTWEISKIIDISERTVVFHLKNSEKKLSAKSRQHAVALATMKGLIKPNVARVRAIA